MAWLARRRLGWLAAGVVTVGLAAALWPFVIEPARIFQVVGVHGPSFWSGRSCGRDGAWLDCRAFPSAPPPREVERFETVLLDARVGTVHYVDREWTEPDSVSWSRAIDSVVDAVDTHGGASKSCGWLREEQARLAADRPLGGASIPTVQVWGFRGFDVRLSAIRFGRGVVNQAVWHLQLSGFPEGDPDCTPQRPRMRLMTLDEWLDAQGRAFHERLGW